MDVKKDGLYTLKRIGVCGNKGKDNNISYVDIIDGKDFESILAPKAVALYENEDGTPLTIEQILKMEIISNKIKVRKKYSH